MSTGTVTRDTWRITSQKVTTLAELKADGPGSLQAKDRISQLQAEVEEKNSADPQRSRRCSA